MKTGRMSFLITDTFSSRIAGCTSAAIITVVTQFPAFFSACTRQNNIIEEVPLSRQIHIEGTKAGEAETIDLFFFDTLGAKTLDAYQRVVLPDRSTPLYGLCSGGAKHLVAISGEKDSDWTHILNYGSMCKHVFSLENDSPENPILVGEYQLEDAASNHIFIHFNTLLSKIRIRSISCDFAGRTYSFHRFTNNKLYLSYAVSECQAVGAGGGTIPVSWINPGLPDSAAVQRLPFPEMLMQEGYGVIGPQRINEERTFYCYANSGEERVTRLVIEGDVEDVHCYYPIDLTNLEPGKCYEFDITIKRMGSPDVEIPVDSGVLVLETRTLPWEDRDEYSVRF